MKITVNKETVEKDKYYLWNRFIEGLSNEDFGDDLSKIQQIAKRCFWYDAEMNSGGHSGYFDCFTDENFNEVEQALIEIDAAKYSKNFRNAIDAGEEDEYMSTDRRFYEITPELTDIIIKYVLDNINEFFIIR